MKAIFTLCCFFAMLGADLHAQAAKPSSKPQALSSNSPQDHKMIMKIQEVLTSRDIPKGILIAFGYNQGHVTLIGSVEREEDKNLIEAKVKGIPGVQNVNSKIDVKPGVQI